ncbi:GtrA family protein [Flintibacter muris]|uniref:GtrA family protein n=1 Tax=Flintibacter muris TaxID=2941327 RepID=UPI00203FCCA4|nr:GtrA family protein [Flintibacter muris]
MKEKILRLVELFDLKKFVKFGLVGVLNTVVDFCVFYVMDRWVIREGPVLVLLGTAVVTGPYLSNAIAYVVANIHSFMWNKLWTFQRRERVTRREAARYLATSAGYVLISTVSLAVCIRILSLPFAAPLVPKGWTNLLAKLPTACVTIFYNYLMNKFWVFKA